MEENILAQNIIRLRKENGYTQQKLAEKLFITSQSVSKWELGEASPSLDMLVQISNLFGVSIDSLLKSPVELDKDVIEMSFAVISTDGETRKALRMTDTNSFYRTSNKNQFGIEKSEIEYLTFAEKYKYVYDKVKPSPDTVLAMHDCAENLAKVWDKNKKAVNKAFKNILKNDEFKTEKLFCIVQQNVSCGWGETGDNFIEINYNNRSEAKNISFIVRVVTGRLLWNMFSGIPDADKRLIIPKQNFLNYCTRVIIENSVLAKFCEEQQYYNNEKNEYENIVNQLTEVYKQSYNVKDFINNAIMYVRNNPTDFEKFANKQNSTWLVGRKKNVNN